MQGSRINNGNGSTAVRDEYTTSKDRIWGDVIKHERVLELAWKKLWENTIVPCELRPANYLKPKSNFRRDTRYFYSPIPSPFVPLKASDVIGWRSSDTIYSMEYFNVKYVSNKKRFEKEQFGYYRELKYIKEPQQDKMTDEKSRDEKFIKHIPKRLIC